MNTQTITTEQIIAQIKEMSSEQIMDLNNILCDNMNMMDDYIHINDEDFFSTYFGIDVIRAVQATFYGDFNYSHEFVKFNGYGNLDSFGYLNEESFFDSIGNIADYIIEDFDTYADFFNF